MARIFLSHSSADNFEALAVRDWLVAEGWDDVFLDIDPRGGIAAADRWERSLHEAANRCEAVVFLVSRKWLASEWCLREFNLAVRLNKRLFGVLIEDIPVAELRSEMTAWQVINLARGQDGVIRRAVMDTGEEKHVTFSKAGLAKLKFGLQRAGLDPRFFEWPPKHDPDRPPYRGMKPLEADDAGIFFGREAQVIEALDRLRGLADAAPPRFLAILGASGAGKSSFMRAGLLPRLERDDRNFLTLPVIRPERAVISGDTGLVASLEEALKRAGHPKSRADIKAALASGAEATANLLAALAEAARAPQLDAAERPAPPAIVIAVDQGEELFSAEGKAEAEAFLTLLASLLSPGTPRDLAGDEPAPASEAPASPPRFLSPHEVGERWRPGQDRGGNDAAGRDESAAILAGVTVRGTPSETRTTAPRIILLVTIRSDSYEALQTAPQLEGIRQSTFSLPPLAKGAYQLVIEGPSVRLRDTNRPLRIEPALTQALLADVEADTSKDALPLLAFTLERLWREHGTTGDLKLADYRTMGGVKGSIEAAVERVMKAAETDPDLRTVADRPALLRRAIIPWLATIDRETNTPRRRVARLSEIPAEAQPFIRLLVAERLLSTEQAFDAMGVKQGDVTVEPAHEALLRQWGQLQQWLDEESAAYAAIDGIKRAAAEWQAHGRDEAWLAHQAGRLEDAERVAARDDFGRLLIAADRDYLAAARMADNARRDHEFARQRQLTRRTLVGAAVAGCLALVAIAFAYYGFDRAREAEDQRLVAEQVAARANEIADFAKQALVRAAEAAKAAEEARVEAEEQRAQAEANAEEAVANETINLAALSRVAYSEGSPIAGVKLALAAWPRRGDEERPRLRRAVESLEPALRALRERMRLNGSANSSAYVSSSDYASATFSADSTRVLKTSNDQTAGIWDRQTGSQLLRLDGHEDTVTSAAFSPDGRRIVTAAGDNSVRVWDATTGRQVLLISGHQDWVTCASFSPDGKQIISSSADRTVRLWDSQTGRQVKAMSGHHSTVNSAAFSFDGRLIVTASSDGTARIWNVASGAQIMVLHGHSGGVNSAEFSPDGKIVVTASPDKTARTWNSTTGQQLLVLGGHQFEVTSAHLSQDGKRLATTSTDSTARIWDAATGMELLLLDAHEELRSAAFSYDGRELVTASSHGTARIWNVVTTETVLPLEGHQQWISSAALSPDGATVISASVDDGTARVWNATTGAEIGPILTGLGDAIQSIAFSPDGKKAVTAMSDNSARIWAVPGWSKLVALRGHENRLESAVFSADGTVVLTTSWDGTARLWDATTGENLRILRDVPGEDEVRTEEADTGVLAAALSPDGTRVAVTSHYSSRVLDTTSGEQLVDLKGGSGSTVIAFSSDGKRIVAGSSAGGGHVWDASTGVQLLALGNAGATSVHFSPDDARIVMASSDTTYVLDSATGAQLRALKINDAAVTTTDISRDGARVLTASEDGGLRIWDISSLEKGDAFQIACQRLGNNIDLSEVEARYGLSKLAPICGDHPPLPVDRAKLQ